MTDNPIIESDESGSNISQGMPETKKRQNLICNFRAPDQQHFQVWKDFKTTVRSQGLDVCFMVLNLCQGWLKSLESANATHQTVTPTQIINLQQQNTFVYSVQIPKRKPFEIICSHKASIRTLWSLAFQAYVTEKARDIERSFCYRDFAELGHDFFRKCALKLKNRGKILPLRPRTSPRFYILKDWASSYPTMNENNEVKPRFTGDLIQPDERQKGDS